MLLQKKLKKNYSTARYFLPSFDFWPFHMDWNPVFVRGQEWDGILTETYNRYVALYLFRERRAHSRILIQS